MEWISVKDRLPEVGKKCLIYGNYNAQGLHRFYDCYVYDDDQRWMKCDRAGWFVMGEEYPESDVSHWMPLPEPPEVK